MIPGEILQTLVRKSCIYKWSMPSEFVVYMAHSHEDDLIPTYKKQPYCVDFCMKW